MTKARRAAHGAQTQYWGKKTRASIRSTQQTQCTTELTPEAERRRKRG